MNRVHGGPTRGVYGHDVNMMMDGEPMNHKTLMKKRNREAMITNGVMMATPPSSEINDYKSASGREGKKKKNLLQQHTGLRSQSRHFLFPFFAMINK